MSNGKESRYLPCAPLRARMRRIALSALAHYHDFDVKPWKATFKMLKWKRDNIDNLGSKRPKVLVIVGPPRCGKTEWAMSFGRPIQMMGRWNLDEMFKKDYTHLVLDDIHSKFRYKRELASGQKLEKAKGKYRREQTINFDKPVIFTFDPNNKVWNDKKFQGYLSDSGAVIVKVSRKLY
ncbi:hypothetical protein TGAM01_v201992 [Trichoderma gamsii]|uniref:Replication-associated protein n=1 Tax=Trichoderma gamsii TaxID=398673 RepID=A0A2P4ZX66_9HYPO|nr:hypothetical protein TGAM01_v201992 [Trichoderma gamsii]PON28884.1 hypothetical protein TGAM01_v201992 [Trichoderma gamsii]